ncbi:hypothetical protein CBW65_20010 [Tumebacillus avium]|uniref:Uncharacterized protein n=1 Tax=Tumebacillus avium TaxID=1903704 RepID=A0A1Y0IQU3_9BACL|nr:hypothetical protein [Tumebacillus avium]ARU63002.1 hypothetical protein CBW65_20010 [Tumebacillus avium]
MGKRMQLAIFAAMFALGLTGYYLFMPAAAPAVTGESAKTPEAEIKTVQISGIIAEKSKTELVGESTVILAGKVKDILPSKWSNPNFERGQNISNVIQTDVIVKVGKVFKGKPYSTKEIAVRIDKGKVDNVEWKSEGFPDFSLNEDVVLFLREDDSDNARQDERYYVLTGMKQGKFTKEVGEGFSNGKDKITAATLPLEISEELEKYKKLPRLADPKIYKP